MRTAGVTTTYHIEVLGEIWMPSTLCAQEYTISDRQIKTDPNDIVAGDLYLDPDYTEWEAIESWLGTNTGDFANIKAVRAVRSELKVIHNNAVQIGDDPVKWERQEVYTRDVIVRDFTEEAQMMYDDAMWGSGDD